MLIASGSGWSWHFWGDGGSYNFSPALYLGQRFA